MIRIITDSTADFPQNEAQALGLRVIPLQVNIDGEMYRDGLDLEPESFYEMLAEAKNLPTTSQPSPEQFLTEFEQAKQAGDEVVCITLSGELSGTLQSAMIAREEVGYAPIHIVDSRNVTLAEQLLVTTRLSIDEIIYKSGFSNRSTFFRGFVLRFGCTPKVYREQKVSEAMETDAGPGTEAGVEAETT